MRTTSFLFALIGSTLALPPHLPISAVPEPEHPGSKMLPGDLQAENTACATPTASSTTSSASMSHALRFCKHPEMYPCYTAYTTAPVPAKTISHNAPHFLPTMSESIPLSLLAARGEMLAGATHTTTVTVQYTASLDSRSKGWTTITRAGAEASHTHGSLPTLPLAMTITLPDRTWVLTRPDVTALPTN